MKKMKASELVLDFTLSPRSGGNVDPYNVRAMQEALAAGAEFPPVIIDRRSKRVIDGFHRVRAVLAHGGPDAEIEVIERRYTDEATMFRDAMRYNSGHGAKLDQCDRVHCLIVAERLSIPIEDVAAALHVPVDKLGELRVGRTATTAGGLSVALKRTVGRFGGQTLTQRQVEANEKLSGMNQVFYVNQIIELIESDMLNAGDDKLIERLRYLHTLLDGVLAPRI